jgi:hypothetical protein
MMQEPREQIVGIPRLSLRAAGREGFTRLGPGGRVNGVEDHNVVWQARVAEWPPRRLQTDGHRLAGTAGAQRGGPGIQLSRSVLAKQGLLLTSRDVNQAAIRRGV